MFSYFTFWISSFFLSCSKSVDNLDSMVKTPEPHVIKWSQSILSYPIITWTLVRKYTHVFIQASWIKTPGIGVQSQGFHKLSRDSNAWWYLMTPNSGFSTKLLDFIMIRNHLWNLFVKILFQGCYPEAIWCFRVFSEKNSVKTPATAQWLRIPFPSLQTPLQSLFTSPIYDLPIADSRQCFIAESKKGMTMI